MSLVDDEAALLEVMRLGLEADFDLELAASAEEAELLLATGKHGVVVCDHMMPGEAGVDFLITVRKRHPAAKRILVTGYMNPDFFSRSTSIAGLSACLVKPVPVADLVAAIRTALVDEVSSGAWATVRVSCAGMGPWDCAWF
ncbi:MAG: response regulator [Undibacterium sp.]|nr:response regulator [Opitutaceae bacterium]